MSTTDVAPEPYIPGSTHLKCPEFLRRENWYLRRFTPEEDAEVMAWRIQAAYRLRAGLMGMPFYAKRAMRERERSGSEMPYWLELQGSEMTLERPAPTVESLQGLSPADLHYEMSVNSLHVVDRLLLAGRGSALVVGAPSDAAGQGQRPGSEETAPRPRSNSTPE